MVDLLHLLEFYDPAAVARRVKLVRHADPRWADFTALTRHGFVEEYQARQSKPVFADTDVILSFMGERGSNSRFIGAFSVDGVKPAPTAWPSGYPFPEMEAGKFRYDLTRLAAFAPLEERMVIDWGQGLRQWVQHLRSKPVVELRPAGFVREFPGYDDVLLAFSDLQSIVAAPEANHAWHRMLSAVAGVYLITDSTTGDLYVGSAAGEGGILSRWTNYAKTRHGGNKRLRDLLGTHPGRHLSFSFSILKTLPRSMTPKEVIAAEVLFKRKLGTRAFGLNAN